MTALQFQPATGEPLSVTYVSLFIPWNGAFIADIRIAAGQISSKPSGKGTLFIGGEFLVGTIADDRSSMLGDEGSLRIVGGGNGWSKHVGRLPYHLKPKLFSSYVLSTTAAAVGETVLDANPIDHGTDYFRHAGPAVTVLEGREWHITPQGVTLVGPWPTSFKDTSQILQSWGHLDHTAKLTTEAILYPGTILVDSRIDGGQTTVRQVTQTWGTDGSNAIATCATEAPKGSSREVAALESLIKSVIRPELQASERYRVVLQDGDGEVTGQAINDEKAPDAKLQYWLGPGMTVQFALGSEVIVECIGGDPTFPRITGSDGTPPIAMTIDVKTILDIGKGGAFVLTSNGFSDLLKALSTAIKAAGPGGPAAATAFDTACIPILVSMVSKKLRSE